MDEVDDDDARVLVDEVGVVVREDVDNVVDLVELPTVELVAGPPGWHCE